MLREAVYSVILAVLGAVAIGLIMYWGAIVYPNKYNDLFRDIEPEQGNSDSNGG
jgi:hypothetical protein